VVSFVVGAYREIRPGRDMAQTNIPYVSPREKKLLRRFAQGKNGQTKDAQRMGRSAIAKTLKIGRASVYRALAD
jgi:DNA-binding CsgD family transcriptional regulator